jgi:hypothetical protein
MNLLCLWIVPLVQLGPLRFCQLVEASVHSKEFLSSVLEFCLPFLSVSNALSINVTLDLKEQFNTVSVDELFVLGTLWHYRVGLLLNELGRDPSAMFAVTILSSHLRKLLMSSFSLDGFFENFVPLFFWDSCDTIILLLWVRGLRLILQFKVESFILLAQKFQLIKVLTLSLG